jgi:hypothetical protein
MRSILARGLPPGLGLTLSIFRSFTRGARELLAITGWNAEPPSGLPSPAEIPEAPSETLRAPRNPPEGQSDSRRQVASQAPGAPRAPLSPASDPNLGKVGAADCSSLVPREIS